MFQNLEREYAWLRYLASFSCRHQWPRRQCSLPHDRNPTRGSAHLLWQLLARGFLVMKEALSVILLMGSEFFEIFLMTGAVNKRLGGYDCQLLVLQESRHETAHKSRSIPYIPIEVEFHDVTGQRRKNHLTMIDIPNSARKLIDWIVLWLSSPL